MAKSMASKLSSKLLISVHLRCTDQLARVKCVVVLPCGSLLQIAVEGCCHGELDNIYETLACLEQKEGTKIDLLICCGDFQVRAASTLGALLCPPPATRPPPTRPASACPLASTQASCFLRTAAVPPRSTGCPGGAQL